MVQGYRSHGVRLWSPKDTYEGRIHFRIRADALKRNLMELPHEGITLGGDLLHGHRAKWDRWGGARSIRLISRRNAPTCRRAPMRWWRRVTVCGSEKHRLLTACMPESAKTWIAFPPSGFPDVNGLRWEAISSPCPRRGIQ